MIKVDNPKNYHTFLSSNKVFRTPFILGFGFLVELECGHVIEFADTTPKEKESKKIFCAQCKVESSIVKSDDAFYRDIVRYRRVKIGGGEP